MSPKQKSSRKRMDSRTRRFVSAEPSVYYRLDPKTQREVQCGNRALRRSQQAQKRKSLKYENQS